MKTLLVVTLLGVATLGFANEAHHDEAEHHEKPATTLPSSGHSEEHGAPHAGNNCCQPGAQPQQDKQPGNEQKVMG